MKFLKVTTFYPEYLAQFYGRNPALAWSTYERQWDSLMADGFGWADFFQRALGAIGHEAGELVINAEPMQRAWVAENGARLPDGVADRWMLEIAYEQVRRFDPEVLFLDDLPTFPGDWIDRVRSTCRNVRLVLGWSGAPHATDTLPKYDALLSCVPEIVTEMRQLGAKVFHLNHAFEPAILERIDLDRAPTIDLSFVGNIVPGSRYHDERRRLLAAVAERFDLRFFSPVSPRSRRVTAKNALKPVLRTVAAVLDRLPTPELRQAIPLPPARSGRYDQVRQLSRRLNRRLHPPVFGLQMFQTLRDSRMTLNSHLGTSRRSASNMRLFEATGVGTCLVTDRKDNLEELFSTDGVVSYGSIEECVEKIAYLQDHPAELAAIAKRGQERTLAVHTFRERAAQLDEIIRGLV
jgi:spore maturation protein CgeB